MVLINNVFQDGRARWQRVTIYQSMCSQSSSHPVNNLGEEANFRSKVIYSFHTRLDDGEGGVLRQKFCQLNFNPLHPVAAECAR